MFKGEIDKTVHEDIKTERLLSSRLILWLGLGGIVFVPIFKTITHLPPYLGMMLSLGVVWMVSEYVHPEDDFTHEKKHLYSAHRALSRIEISSILFPRHPVGSSGPGVKCHQQCRHTAIHGRKS